MYEEHSLQREAHHGAASDLRSHVISGIIAVGQVGLASSAASTSMGGGCVGPWMSHAGSVQWTLLDSD